MRPEPMPAAADARSGPLVLRFENLFDHAGTLDLRYSAAARELSGREVVIEGYLSQSHGPQPRWSLVDQQGLCPDCSPVPAIALPGARAPMRAGDDGPVRVRGRLDYGLRIDDGVASMLRIDNAIIHWATGHT
jgi:hypothetical protein